MCIFLSINSFIVQRFVVRLIVIFYAGYRHIKLVMHRKGHPAPATPHIYDTILWLQFILLKQLLECNVGRCFIPLVIICLLPPFPKSDSFDLQHLIVLSLTHYNISISIIFAWDSESQHPILLSILGLYNLIAVFVEKLLYITPILSGHG